MIKDGLRCVSVCAGYRNHCVLHDITADFPAGRLTVLIGPNGSGKSTLLKTLAGLIAPQSGEVFLQGHTLRQYSDTERAKKVTILTQTRPTPDLNVYQTVLSGRFPYLTWPRRYTKKDEEAADRALSQTGIEHLAGRSLRELSGGERQRVYLAAALCQETGVLLLDEPCSALDAGAALDLMALLHTLCETGKTVIASLHDLPMALAQADELFVLENGRLAGCGTPSCVITAAEKAFGIKLTALNGDGIRRYFAERMHG